MASLPSFNVLVMVSLLFALFVQATLGGITCEQLGKEECAFAVSSLGQRCVLEKYVRRSGLEVYKCTTSEIEADKFKGLIETNQCIESCGLDRDTLGISSDSLFKSRFTQKLCSPQCYKKCPNVVDLYFNLAAGEGVYLPKLCETQAQNLRRVMAGFKSSGIVAPGPINSVGLLDAPGPVASAISPAQFMSAPSPVASAISPAQFTSTPASAPVAASPSQFIGSPSPATFAVSPAPFTDAPVPTTFADSPAPF